MKSSRFWLCLAAAIIVQSLLPTRSALADTYSIFTLDSDEARFVYALNSSGEVVLSVDATGGGTCPSSLPSCYETFLGGALSSISTLPPEITPDEGAPCSPSLPSGSQLFAAICNNGRVAISAEFPGDSMAALYTGPDPSDLLAGDAGDLIYLNSEGDIVWNDPNSEFWFEAIDETSQVPEPGTLTLLATGLAAAAGAIRRLHS